jgi:hypothetical protein
MVEAFPVGGSRQAVFDALRQRQFTMANFSDKWWTRSDGLEAHVYGSGSRLRLLRTGIAYELPPRQVADGPMSDMLALIDAGNVPQ